MRRSVIVAAAAGALVLVPGLAASAHPLGNFTVNRYAGLRVRPERVFIHYVIDMAEIPTFQDRGKVDANGDRRRDAGERDAYAARTCAAIARGISVRMDGRAMPLRVDGTTLAFPPGAADLETTRLECELSAPTANAHEISYRDSGFAGRVGWREVTASGDGATLESSDVPSSSISDELRRYPEDLLQLPPNVVAARVRFRPGGAAAASAGGEISSPTFLPRGVDGATRAFTSFLARRRLSVPFGALAVLGAVVLGLLHALAPGHGKTVMAAYLVGQKGSLRQGALIGLTVTATHTAGVLVLGVIVSVSTTVAPERLYPLLGLASGAMLSAIGVGLLRRAVARRSHPHHHNAAPATPGLGTRSLLGMGFAGGLVPSPSALVVLLGAIALGRAWFGVVLVVAYGVGMAATLSGAGLLLVKTRALLERKPRRPASLLARVATGLPLATAAVIVGVGLTLAARGAAQL